MHGSPVILYDNPMRKQYMTLLLFCLLLLIQPGFNSIQQYEINAGELKVLPADVPVPKKTVLPVRKTGVVNPSLTAISAIVVDKTSGAILYAKNPDYRLFPASVTKIMTALVALDAYPLEREVTITTEHEAIGSKMKLERGETITVRNLLKGLLIASGNDAAYALADAYPGGYGEFVKRMNEKAREFHLDNTMFTNVSGVEQDEHVTTVRDTATLTKEAMKDPFFRETVGTKELVVTDVSGKITHYLYSTNKLLGAVDGLIGVKTGWTDLAGECLVTETLRDGQDIITVVFASEDRFGESRALIRWAYQSFDWVEFNFSGAE